MLRRAVVVAALVCACSSSRQTAPAVDRDASWRDQYLFIGDDGTVLALTLQRSGAGAAEAKGWLGRGGRWQHRLYHRYTMDPARAGEVAAAVIALAGSPGTPVRGRLDDRDRAVTLELRLRAAVLRIDAAAVTPLGSGDDPEGPSIYRAGRARLSSGGEAGDGWLIVEATPPDRPHRAFVDYGDFVLAALASPRGVFVFKRSRGVAGFDRVLGRRADGGEAAPPGTGGDLDGDRVVVGGAGGELAAAAVLDRDTSSGVAPGNRPVTYQVILLGGDWAGVAFAIGSPPPGATLPP